MKYLSAAEYSKKVNLGIEKVKEQCRNGELECYITSGGHYKIAIREDSISLDKYNELLKKYNKLLGVIELINKATSIGE